jgi:uncharacterized membrane protein YhhN
MKRWLLLLFAAASTVELTAHVMGLLQVHYFSKPLLIPLLLGYYVLSVTEDNRSRQVMLALIFSWAGDVLLLFAGSREWFFMAGLLSFLTAHVFYIFAYQYHQSEDTSRALLGVQRFRFSLPIILTTTGLITVLYVKLGAMKIPLIAYALVIAIMAMNALFRFGRTTPGSFSRVFLGAILFMISDSMIAINKFLTVVSFGGFWIMATYILAQFLIVEGLTKHE